MKKIDDIDMKILAELIQDASLSVPKLSKKINVNASVIYSRIKRLIKKDLIKKFTVEVNEEALGLTISAIIGINIEQRLRDGILKELLNLNEVRSVSEVTGRFDLLVEVKTRTLDELHRLISENIGRINGIVRTETFMEMKKTRRIPHYTIPV
ncbi:MAG: Lrp/AsnC family transcriptional regulator [Nitrososphaerota archaeon]|nr:Lrp/AsnC family transcriptional regulator [Nitrososphaerales archaeon]MDW8044820.1 Lrp/AsnC family transcriptional regulator [Nitrososphaerota archaeon]